MPDAQMAAAAALTIAAGGVTVGDLVAEALHLREVGRVGDVRRDPPPLRRSPASALAMTSRRRALCTPRHPSDTGHRCGTWRLIELEPPSSLLRGTDRVVHGRLRGTVSKGCGSLTPRSRRRSAPAKPVSKKEEC